LTQFDRGGVRRVRAATTAWCIAASGLLAAAAPIVAIPQPPNPHAEALPDSPAELAAFLLTPTTPPERLLPAAGRLLTLADQGQGREVIRNILADTPLDSPGRAALVTRISELPEAPPWMAAPLISLASRVPAEQVAPVLAALSSVRTRGSARALLGYARPEMSPDIRRAAFHALARLTGRDDLGDNLTEWQAWLDGCEGLTDAQWRALLLTNLARRADEADNRRRAVTAELLDALRRLHLATPLEERSALLASFLRHTQPEVRALGVDLVLRELANGTRLNGPTLEASFELLAHHEAAVRRQGASLLARLAPPESNERILTFLRTENDPGVAAALLDASSRTPDRGLIDPVVRWMGSATPTAAAASQAAWRLLRAGLLPRGPELDRVLHEARRLAGTRPTPWVCFLLAAAGDDDDLLTVAGLLHSSDPAIRLAAAEALAPSEHLLDRVVAAARTDPNLLEIASRGIVMRGATAEDFLTLAAIDSPSPDTRRRALARTTRAMPATEVMRAADLVNDAALREMLLASLTSEGRILSEQVDPAQRRALASGLTALARLRLDRAQFAESLAAINALPDIERVVDPGTVQAIRFAALVGLNRLDLAQEQGLGPDAWLEALEAYLSLPHADAIAERIGRAFNGRLSESQTERLRALAARIERKGANASGDEPPPH
jgi:hypothetical protein